MLPSSNGEPNYWKATGSVSIFQDLISKGYVQRRKSSEEAKVGKEVKSEKRKVKSKNKPQKEKKIREEVALLKHMNKSSSKVLLSSTWDFWPYSYSYFMQFL